MTAVTERRYTKVNYERVHRAMTEVGRRASRERMAEIVARGGRICTGEDRRTGLRCQSEADVAVGHFARCWDHVEQVAPPAHDYGPHRPEDAPTTVEVYGPGKWPQLMLAPIPPALVRQRQLMNDLAHAASRAAYHPEGDPHVRSVRS